MLRKLADFLEDDKSLRWSTSFSCVTGTHEYVRDFSDLMSVTLCGNHVHSTSDTRWGEILLFSNEIQQENILSGVYKMSLRESEQLNTTFTPAIKMQHSMANQQAAPVGSKNTRSNFRREE